MRFAFQQWKSMDIPAIYGHTQTTQDYPQKQDLRELGRQTGQFRYNL